MNNLTSPEQHRMAEEDQTRQGSLRSLGRSVVGYSLGFLSVGAGIASIASLNPLGGALSYGAGWASRQIIRPLHTVENDPHYRNSRIKRAGLFAGGMAITYYGASLFSGAFFNSFAHSWSIAGRLLGAGIGLGGIAAGTTVIDRSFGTTESTAGSPAPLQNLATA